jgi:hypothetical protein
MLVPPTGAADAARPRYRRPEQEAVQGRPGQGGTPAQTRPGRGGGAQGQEGGSPSSPSEAQGSSQGGTPHDVAAVPATPLTSEPPPAAPAAPRSYVARGVSALFLVLLGIFALFAAMFWGWTPPIRLVLLWGLGVLLLLVGGHSLGFVQGRAPPRPRRGRRGSHG